MATVNSAKDIIEGIRQAFFAQRIRETLLVHDAAKWITVHPNGKGVTNSGENAKGSPVLLDEETGEVLGGMGGKFTGMHISEAVSTVRTENSQHVIRRGQEQRKDPEGFAKQQKQKMQEAEAAVAKVQKEVKAPTEAGQKDTKPKKSFSGAAAHLETSVVNINEKDDIRVGAYQFPCDETVKDHAFRKHNANMYKAYNTETGKWKTDSGVKFKDREAQKMFNHLEHQALLYQAMQTSVGEHGFIKLSAETISEGDKLVKQYRECKREWVKENSGALSQKLDTERSNISHACNEMLGGTGKTMKNVFRLDEAVPFSKKTPVINEQRGVRMLAWYQECGRDIRNNKGITHPVSDACQNMIKAEVALAEARGLKRWIDYYHGSDKDKKTRAQQLVATAEKNYKTASQALMAYHDTGSPEVALIREYSKAVIGDGKSSYHPASLAGVTKGPDMDFSKANHQACNPYFLKVNDYVTYTKEDGTEEQERAYAINCQSCVAAYEARRRGYDVEAMPNMINNHGITAPTTLSYDTVSAFRNKETGVPPDVTHLNKFADLKRVIKTGERYHVSYRHSLGGHIVTAEKDQNGAVIIYDPQTGERFTTSAYDNGVNEKIRAYRVDNCDIAEDVQNNVLTKSGESDIFTKNKLDGRKKDV